MKYVLVCLLVLLSSDARAGKSGSDNHIINHPFTVAATTLAYVSVDSLTPTRYKWISASTFTSLTLVGDWLTTLDINRNNDKGYKEAGWASLFIGADPSRNSINRYFAVNIALVWAGNWMIDQIPNVTVKSWVRNTANITLSVLETSSTAHNISVGLSLTREF